MTHHMDIQFADIRPDLRLIKLSGRMDILGTDSISERFAALISEKKHNVLVDVTGVSFLASIGIRALISNAKTLNKLGGSMALVVSKDTSVAKTLETTGIEVLIKIYDNLKEAQKALTGQTA